MKISDENLKQLQELQVRFEQLTFVYGDLHNKKRMLEGQIAAIETEIDSLERARESFSNALKNEMGSAGTVNLETGEFTPDA